MATISVPVLTIENKTSTIVKITVGYTLTPSQIEKLAGTVFSESIKVMGNDLGNVNDTTISTFTTQAYRAETTTTNIARTRTVELLKSQLNEDAGFTDRGSEQYDEILAKVTITYAANPPTTPTLPEAANSNQVAGAWR